MLLLEQSGLYSRDVQEVGYRESGIALNTENFGDRPAHTCDSRGNTVFLHSLLTGIFVPCNYGFGLVIISSTSVGKQIQDPF